MTGASDKTLRQWDMTTGQCVMTMDILWAISHPPRNAPGTTLPSSAAAGVFSVPAPPAADGNWDLYTDFVGGVQFWGYGLVSGSGDGAVRMWDSKSFHMHDQDVSNCMKCGLVKHIGHYMAIQAL